MDFILQYTTIIQACTQSIDDIIAAVKTTQLLRNPDSETDKFRSHNPPSHAVLRNYKTSQGQVREPHRYCGNKIYSNLF